MNHELLTWLLAIHAGCALFMAGLIWFVQVVHYPLFDQVGKAEFTAYASRISDMIERVPTTYLGSDSLDGEPVFYQDNIGSGTILGLSAATRFRLSTRWNLDASLAWTYGENDDLDVPLTRIPPLRGIVTIQRNFNRGSAQLVTAWADRQDRLSPEDLRDTRIPKGGTPGYVALHLRGQFVVNTGVTLRAGIENILASADSQRCRNIGTRPNKRLVSLRRRCWLCRRNYLGSD